MATVSAHPTTQRISADRVVSADWGEGIAAPADDLPDDLPDDLADDFDGDLAGDTDMGNASHLDANGEPRIVERRFIVAQEFHG